MSRHPAPRPGEPDAIDPLAIFADWLADAHAARLPEPTAMTLASATASGRPSARIVLLKEFDERGFVFATNYESRKAVELADNPWAALVFLWQPLQRQVRVEGRVSRCQSDESDRLYAGRPRGAQLGAWASRQSRELAGRRELERRVAEVGARYAETVPRPPYWGGYRVVPRCLEFWCGRSHRLHDRFLYTRDDGGLWSCRRLAP